MLPVGVLMVEHRLIERMVRLLSAELKRIKANGIPNAEFLLSAVDFMRNYSDRCHHGKEEGVLFKSLGAKPLSPEHQKTMRELISEHVYARAKVSELDECRQKFCRGDYSVVLGIAGALEALTELYPRHIEKEDKHFFIPSMEYFTDEEKSAMLEEFGEFDNNLFKEKYIKIVDSQELAAK